ncbi:MAG: 50S ribosomal protein L1 [Candidatus Cloacimonetes bacterium]|nr:50S ribosomal protein L1 [Candidatus Cloacimonadota bacterium]MCF7814953.1 50S ribosomal protein L1 [Candidatus Cloacimonadota bacterium]MCF7869235.1 50S ribosomal protein L1 [Candidatus Cloacimonadota bacterium]MCF7884652.1 50S ribosomal protein L1 [Candidatus Cloacimonadota bacterium]
MASKRYRKAQSMIDKTKRYELTEAVEILKSFPTSKFDETVEVHMNLGVDPRKADQQIRNSLVLPHGSGKQVTVLVFAEGDKAEEAKKAGADYVGVDEYVEKIQSGWMEFDVVIATPNLMGKIGRLGRVLGPRGLMPNPKVGTVTMDIEKAVNDSKGGKVTYRVDKFSNLHIIAGKISFEAQQLKENLLAIIAAIMRERPAALKGIFIRSIAITSTMGPAIKLDIPSVTLEAKK